MGWIRRSIIAAGALLAVGAVAPAASLAAGVLPYDSAQTNPQQSANFTAGPGPLEFKVTSPDCPGAPMYIEVANVNEFAPDGRLIASARKDYFALSEASPGVYAGQTSGQWLQTPGTYYWQAQAVTKCTNEFEADLFSPVRAVVINPGTPSPGSDQVPEVPEDSAILTIAQGKAEIPGLILKKTKKIARGLKRKCSRRGEGSILVVACTVAWHDNKKFNYNGAMRLALNDDGTLAARFDGRRATKACLKKKGGKKCYKKWTFNYDSV